MHSVSVKLPGSSGQMMAGTLDIPDSPPVAWAMFSHCFTGSRFTPAAARVCKALAERGIACLRFDFPGLGQSEGNFAETSFSSNVADLVAAYRWLEQNHSAPQLLIGHSLGGAAALKAGAQMPKLRAVATIGAPFDPAHSVLHFADRISEVDANGAVTLTLGGRELTISRDYLEDLAEINPEAYLGGLRRPLLLLHAPTDQTVGIDNAQKIFQLSRYPKSLIALDKADHLCTRPGVAQRAANLIRTWVEPYLADESGAGDTDVMPEGVAEARSIPAGKFTDLVRIERETITTDRERSLGGRNLGLSPTSLLIAALASATSQSIRIAAKEARIRGLDDVKVTVSRVVGSDEEATVLRRRIELIGDLDEGERSELLATAGTSVIERIITTSSTLIDGDN